MPRVEVCIPVHETTLSILRGRRGHIIVVIYGNDRRSLLLNLIGLLSWAVLLRLGLVTAKGLRLHGVHISALIQLVLRPRHGHALRDHVAVVLIHRVVLVAVGVDINVVKVIEDLILEKALDHGLALLSGQLLCQPKQQLVLVSVTTFVELPECIFEVLHRVVAQLQEKLDDIVSVLLLRVDFSVIH